MSKWITFRAVACPAIRKTKIWEVMPIDLSSLLGYVKWYAAWRQYSFFPEADTVYERQCLRDIADFCEKETNKHREAAKLRSVPSATGTVSPD